MKGWIFGSAVAALGGVAGLIRMVNKYALPYAIGKLHDCLEHENADDRAFMVAFFTWVRRRGPAFGLTTYKITELEERAFAGFPEETRHAIEDLTHEAVVKAVKEIGG